MQEDPRLQKVFSERIVGLKIQGLGKMELKRAIKKAGRKAAKAKILTKTSWMKSSGGLTGLVRRCFIREAQRTQITGSYYRVT